MICLDYKLDTKLKAIVPKSILNNHRWHDITYRYSYERWMSFNIGTFTNANLNAKANFHKVFGLIGWCYLPRHHN